ncbi:uncharacterized protein [Embiotoca jacksoni]|uniref:uncharacterized protein n=1 Tax=Embiotoca jacksoni TaxID=100190 RepID=UPI0037046375
MVSVTELLLETLAGLSDEELNIFNQRQWTFYYQRRHKVLLRRRPLETSHLQMSDLQTSVFIMVQIHRQNSVEETRKILMEMKRMDLLQKLSHSSSGPKEKHLDEHLSALILKVAEMAAVEDLLQEALDGLSQPDFLDFKWFLQFTFFQKSLPWNHVEPGNRTMIKDLLMRGLGRRSVEVTREFLMDLNRTDLLPMFSGSISLPKEKHCVDERWPALIQEVETMVSVTELLLETLAGLSDEELNIFNQRRWSLDHQRRDEVLLRRRVLETSDLQTSDLQTLVFIMVQIHRQNSVEETRKILMEMKRMDLLQKLSHSSSGPKEKPSVDERLAALIQKVATIAAVKQLLLETLNDLSNKELEDFSRLLPSILSQRILSLLSWRSLPVQRADIVATMVDGVGHQSVEVTREALKKMNRTDLLWRLSDSSSASEEKPSVEERRAAQLNTEELMAASKQLLLKTLEYLNNDGIKKFKYLLQFTCFQKSLPSIKINQLVFRDKTDKLVDVMMEELGQQSVEVTREVLMDMNRTDLEQRMSEISSRSKESCVSQQRPSGSLELEDCRSVLDCVLQPDSAVWTKVEPEVSRTDEEAPTYSLQSEAGHFECSVSGLRWICEDKASFHYQFPSWGGHLERMKHRQYMPAGPLMDVTLTAGKLSEVHLPHWICIKDNPTILDKFAVLHIEDCGDVVENSSEVTSSHVKLIEPIFSPRAVLIKLGFPVRINCSVLIYKANTAFLTLHVYLIPQDPGLQQKIDKSEISYGYKIQKPHPEKSLKIKDRFNLTSDLDAATIYPEALKLRKIGCTPNFFEVYIENPDRHFQLELTQEKQTQPVWRCAVRKDEYETAGHVQENLSGDREDEQLSARMKRAATISPDRQKLFEAFGHLNLKELKEFKWFLKSPFDEELPNISSSRLETADMLDLVDLMLQNYGRRSVEVTKEVFSRIRRNDLVSMLSDSSS